VATLRSVAGQRAGGIHQFNINQSRSPDMSVTHGADVVQLRDLGSKLTSQTEAIATILSVGTAVESTAWVGPAREALLGEWTTGFATTLARLQAAFETAGRECSARADGLEQAMGGAGGGTP
jgi:hypothetical protein